jgi:hypothetical protein
MMKLEEVALLAKHYDVPALKKLGFYMVEYNAAGQRVQADADDIVDSVDLANETHYREHEADCCGIIYRFRAYTALGVDVVIAQPVQVAA